MKAKVNINKRRPEKQYKKSFSQKQSVNLFAYKQQKPNKQWNIDFKEEIIYTFDFE